MKTSAQSSNIAGAHGIWILSDDAYERLYYGDGAAPSFLDIADAGDRVVSANTFSKSWLMTGWRLGWIMAPQELIANLGTLIEYNTSCAPCFVQRAGIVAIEQGEPVIARTLSPPAKGARFPHGAAARDSRNRGDAATRGDVRFFQGAWRYRHPGVLQDTWFPTRDWASPLVLRSGRRARASYAGASRQAKNALRKASSA